MLGYDDEGNEVSLGEAPIREPKQGRVTETANASLAPEARALLDTIAGTESPGYNVRYGGKRFEGYDDHPRIGQRIERGPNAGQVSKAAGRYQFITSTWDAQAKKLGLKDFSPESQDIAAWDLAESTYGRRLLADLQSGDPNRITRVGRRLGESKQWTSLPGGIEATTNNSRFVSDFKRNLQKYSGGSSAPSNEPASIGFTDDQVTFPEEPTTEEIRQSMPAQPVPTQPPTLLERGKGLLGDVGQAITPPPVRNLMDEERARRAKPPELLKPNQSYLDLENNLQMNLNPQFVEQVKQAYEAAAPEDRQRLINQPGEVGQVAKYIDQQYQKAVGVTSLNPALDGIGGRREDIVQRNLGSGMEPQSAQIMADREVRFPGAMKPTGQAQSTTFDFDRFNRLKDAGPVTRGVEQGVDLLKSQAAGLNKMAADLGVVLGVPGASEYGRAQTKARGKLGMRQNEMGEAPTAFDRNLEGAIASTISNAPALVAGLFTGGEAIPLMGMGAQVAGDEYARGLEEGLTPQQSLARAVSFGAAEVLGEKIGFKGQLDLIKKATKGSWADFEKMFVKNLAEQAIGEEFTTAAEARIDGSQVGLNKELTTRQLFDQMKDTLYQTVLQTTIMGAPGAMGAGARSLKKSDARYDQPYADAFKLIKDTPEAAAAYDQVINTRLGELRKDPEFRAIMENETDKSRKDAGLERGNQARQILAERRALRAKAPTLTDIQGAPAQGDLPEEDTSISSTGIPGDPNAQDPAGASTAPAEPTGTTQAPVQEGQSQAVNAAQGPQVTPDISPEIRQVSDNEFQIVDTNTGTVISQHPTDVDAFEALDQLNADRETTTATQETTNEGQNQEANPSGQEGLLNIPGQAPGSIPMPAGGQVIPGTTEGANVEQSAASAATVGTTPQAGQSAPEGVGAILPPGAATAGPTMAATAGVTPQADQAAIQAPGVANQTILTGAPNANDPTAGTGGVAPGTAAGSALAQGVEGGAGTGTVDGRDRLASGSVGGDVGATATASAAVNPVSEPPLERQPEQNTKDYWDALDEAGKSVWAEELEMPEIKGQAWDQLPLTVRRTIRGVSRPAQAPQVALQSAQAPQLTAKQESELSGQNSVQKQLGQPLITPEQYLQGVQSDIAASNTKANDQDVIDEYNTAVDTLNAGGAGDSGGVLLQKIKAATALPRRGFVQRRIAESIAQVFGHRVVYIEHEDGTTELDRDGAIIGSRPDVILLNKNSQDTFSRVVAHELTHGLRRRAPKIYADMVTALREVYSPIGVSMHLGERNYEQELPQKGDTISAYPGLTDPSRNEEEWVSDFVSDVIHKPTALFRVAVAMNKQRPGSGGKFLRAVDGFMSGLIQKLQGAGFNAEAAIAKKDLQRARNAVTEALAQYVNAQQTGTEPEFDGPEILESKKRDIDATAGQEFTSRDNVGEYNLSVERAERKRNIKSALSPEETQAITAAAADKGVPAKDALTAVRARKNDYPLSAGWHPMEAVGIETKSSKKGGTLIAPVFKKVLYTFNKSPGETKIPKAKWTRTMADRLTKEVQEIIRRAEQGDANAKIIMGHANWYRAMADRLRAEFGGFADVFADLLGATSPQTAVPQNWKDAIHALRRFVRGDYDAQLTEFEQWLADGKTIDKFKKEKADQIITKITGAKFGANSDKAMKAMLGMWRAIQAGDAPKARNFALNLIGQSDKATIDLWASRLLQRLAGHPRLPPPLETAVPGNHLVDPSKVGGAFGFAQDVFEMSAEDLRQGGLDIRAPDLQAIVWFLEKEYWTKNNWTNKAGEGGSFEEQLDKTPTAVYQAGFSIQDDSPPSDEDVSAAMREVDAVLKNDDNVMAYRMLPTRGLYGNDVERSFDTEVVGNQNWQPGEWGATLAKMAKATNQKDIFLSRVLGPNESHPNARPGLVISFKNDLTADEVKPILDTLRANGVDGFTLSVSPVHARNLKGGQEAKSFQGIRIQYVPEFTLRAKEQGWKYDEDEFQKLTSGDDAQVQEIMKSKRKLLDDARDSLADILGVAHAAVYRFDTLVIGKENYDDFIGRPEGINSEIGKGAPGQSVTERAQGAARRLGVQRRQKRGATVLQRESGSPDIPASNRRPDAVGNERAGSSAAQEVRPTYGQTKRGGVRAVGVHYSSAERQALDGSFYGTGATGAEAERVKNAADQRLANRIYFYINAGQGVSPEQGVGGNAHTVLLKNLYDINADPLSILENLPGATAAEHDNNMESAIIDAGFDGYVADFGNQRAAVLIGDHKVPVRFEGQGRPQVEEGERAEPNANKRLARLMGKDWSRKTPQAWGEYVKSINPSLYDRYAASFTGTSEKFWPDEMASRAKKIPTLEEQGITDADIQAWGDIPASNRRKPAPKKAVTAYKLFRVEKSRPGELFPLFVKMIEGAEQVGKKVREPSIPVGTWQDAEIGEQAASGRVKSKLGELAFRPGWHAGDLPLATHIGTNLKVVDGKRRPTARAENQVWAEVEFAADVDYQLEANRNGINKNGKLVAAQAHITDRMPEDGFYRYKTSPNMVGQWLIGGSMKINRILTDDEVKAINDAAGVADLPREQPFDSRKYGFADIPASNRRGIDARILADNALPAGSILPSAWKQALTKTMPEIVPQLDAQGVFDGNERMFKDELVRKVRDTLGIQPPDRSPKAAGIMFKARDTGRIFLAKRSTSVAMPNTWSIPGGAVEDGEDLETAARREVQEEIGDVKILSMSPVTSTQWGKAEYTTFMVEVPTEFKPKLNSEHTAGQWFDADKLPENIHPGLDKVKDQVRRAVDIPASNRRQTSTPEFKRWFGKSTIIDESGNPRVMYHGTNADIARFNIGQADAIFVTPDPGFASGFSEDKGRTGANVMPVYVAAENPFDYDNAEHVQALTGWLVKNHDGKITVTMPRVPPMNLDPADLGKRTGTGNWLYIESKPVQEYLKAHHDGFWVKERGKKNLGVYQPTQIKSASGNRGTFSKDDPDIVASNRRNPNPTFYSQLARGFESSKMNSMPGSQWRAWLFSNKAKLGIKDDEIAWTGIEDYLTLNAKEKLTKADIASYLTQNGVRVQDVMRGGDIDKRKAAWSDLIAILKTEDNLGYDRASEAAADLVSGSLGVDQVDVDDVVREKIRDSVDKYRADGIPTKYDKYTIPGGQNYRELLITLPKVDIITQEDIDSAQKRYEAHTEISDEFAAEGNAEKAQAFKEKADKARAQYEDLVKRKSSQRLTSNYRSGHWDEKNVLAHLRFDERTDADGNKVMFIQEIQSDYGQEGKKKGFANNKKVWLLKKPGDQTESSHPTKEEAEQAMQRLARAYGDEPSALGFRVVEGVDNRAVAGLPPAPFVTDTKAWVSLALKRAIRYASENGFDKIAFANGQQNADLYDLSKQVTRIEYRPQDDGLFDVDAYAPGQGKVLSKQSVTADGLEDIVGKEIAKKMVDRQGKATGPNNKWFELSGLDLKVGGEGMRYFYDSLVPSVANDVLKRLGGGRVGQVKIGGVTKEILDSVAQADYDANYDDLSDRAQRNVMAAAQDKSKAQSMSQPGFDITPALQDKALDGMPLFSNRRNVLNQPALATWTTPDDSKLDNYVYLLQDKHIDTKRIVEKLGSRVSDAWDPYLKETLYHGRAAKDVDDFKVNEIKPLLQAMSTRGITIGELETFLHNRHAKEANEQIARINQAYPDGGSGILTQDAQDYLNNLPAGKRTDLEAMAAQIDAITAGTRRLLVESGLETQDTIDAWEATYADYVPLQRESEDVLNRGMGTGQGFSTKGPASKRRTGSGKNVVDIMANVMMQRERAITRAEKNKVGLALYGLAIQNPNPGFWYPVNPDAVKKPASVAQELVNNGMLESDLAGIIQEPTVASVNPRTGLVEYKINPALRNRDNVLAVRIKGKDRFLFFSTENERAVRMAQSLKNLDAPEMHGLLNAFRYITRYVSSINTQYNPIFGVVNLLRDTQGAMLNLSTTPIAGKQTEVAAKIAPAMAGIYGDLRADRKGNPRKGSQWSQLWEEFQRVGGKTGYRDMYATADDRMKALEKELKAIQEGKVKRLTRGLFDWLSDYNETLENAVRLSAYKVGTESGMTKEQAAVMAKELTVNFNRKGQIASQAGALYAFFNAAVQGTARLAETVKGPAGKKIVAGGLIMGVVQAMMMAAAGYDDDEPPEFLRERNFIIPMPSGKYVSIPMPLGFHVLPNTGRVLTEIAINPDGAGKKIAGLLGSFFEAFNPIGSAGWSVQTIAPTFADPLVALSENRDAFGKEIAKKDRSATSPTPGFTRTKDTASWLSKRLAWGLNRITGGTDYTQGALSPTPDQLDYVFSQATGGVGREVMKIEQAASAWMTGEELPPYKYPLGVGRFVGDVKSQSAESNRFYANLTRLNELENEIKGRAKDGKDVAGFLRSNPLATLVPAGNQMERAVSELRSRKRKLIAQNAPKATIKALEGQIASQMKVLNDRVKAAAR